MVIVLVMCNQTAMNTHFGIWEMVTWLIITSCFLLFSDRTDVEYYDYQEDTEPATQFYPAWPLKVYPKSCDVIKLDELQRKMGYRKARNT